MPASKPPIVSSDSRTHIAFDLHCISCGYNLRTLQYAGTCPECGRLVSLSLRSGKLIFASPDRLRKLHKGATVLIAAMFAVAPTQALLFLLWPLLSARLMAKGSHGSEVLTLIFGFGFATVWMAGVRLLTAPRQSDGRAPHWKARRDDLPRAILALSLVPFVSTIATIILVGDAAARVSAFPTWRVALLVVAVAGSASLCLAMLLLFAHFRTIVRREVCKGLHRLFSVLITIGAILGGLWTILLFVSEIFALLFAYPPLSILAGIALRAARFRGTMPPSAIRPPGSAGASSILPGLIILGVVLLLALGGSALVLWALIWFRKLLAEAICADATHTHSDSPDVEEGSANR